MTSVQEGSLGMNKWCPECGAAAGDDHKMSCDYRYTNGIEEGWITNEEDDWLDGVTCNPDAPEECESCQ